MTDGIVFIHGGAHGKWVWDKILVQLPLPSIAVDLPGRGDRPYDGTLVTLDRCVDAVLEDVEAAGFERVLLVGHSMGGLTITEFAYRYPERVTHLVYLDAVAFTAGVNQLSFMEGVVGYAPDMSDPTECLPEFDKETARSLFMSDLSEEDFEAAYAQLNPEPKGMMLASASGLAKDILTTYVWCTKGGGEIPRRHSVDALREACPDFTYLELESDHDLMLSRPGVVRDLVSSIAASGHVTTPLAK